MALKTKAEVVETLKTLLEEKAECKVTKKAVGEVVDALSEAIKNELVNGNEVVLPGIGKLVVVETAARTGFNPQKQEKIEIPASRKVKLKVSKTLKEAVKS